MNTLIQLVDSINYLQSEHRGKVILSGSHGGLYSAYKALSVGVTGLVLNDAGGGLQGAGLESLSYGDEVGLPVALVAHTTARIGDAADMLARGKIAAINGRAKQAGVVIGQACERALAILCQANVAVASQPVYQVAEYRTEIAVGTQHIVCVDSASLVCPHDHGGVIVTGSHGGLIGGASNKAFNVRARFAAFNDAGVGIDDAGIGRLEPLNTLGIAAATVSHKTARIGHAISTYEEGEISYLNEAARQLGMQVGMPLKAAIVNWLTVKKQV